MTTLTTPATIIHCASDFVSTDTAALASHMDHCASKRSRFFGLHAALELVHAYPGAIDLLLSDVVLPGMSGPNLAKQIAEYKPMIKHLYMSGYTDDAIVHHGVLEREMHFIGKPFTAIQLTHKIREVLDVVGPGEKPRATA